MITRRSLLLGALATPAVVRAESLMKIKPLEFTHRYSWVRHSSGMLLTSKSLEDALIALRDSAKLSSRPNFIFCTGHVDAVPGVERRFWVVDK